MAIASQQAVLGYNINGPLFRTVVGIVALRTIVSRNQVTQRVVTGCSTVFLLLLVVVGLVLQ
jgi:hypothetical protein